MSKCRRCGVEREPEVVPNHLDEGCEEIDDCNCYYAMCMYCKKVFGGTFDDSSGGDILPSMHHCTKWKNDEGVKKQ